MRTLKIPVELNLYSVSEFLMDERDLMSSMVDITAAAIGHSKRARITGIVQSKHKMKVEHARYVRWVSPQLKVQTLRHGVCGF